MCGRYYFSVDLLDEIRELVEPGDWKLELGLLEKDMHPGDVAPVITIRDHTAQGYAERGSVEWGSAERGNVERGNVSPAPVFLGIQKMRWGFKAPGGKGLVFNARSESVLEKRMFRDSVSHRRVAVPVSWFYEWNQSKEKYTFTREDGQVLFLAPLAASAFPAPSSSPDPSPAPPAGLAAGEDVTAAPASVSFTAWLSSLEPQPAAAVMTIAAANSTGNNFIIFIPVFTSSIFFLPAP